VRTGPTASRLFVVGVLALLIPQVVVVGVAGCARAGHDLFENRQGVTVGLEKSQVIAAGDTVPVLGPVLGGVADRGGVAPRVLAGARFQCTQQERQGDHQGSIVATCGQLTDRGGDSGSADAE
jgi:hypothetical protein